MKSDWLSLNLKTSLLVGASSLSAIGTTSGIFSSSNQDVLKTVKNSAEPIVAPFKSGYLKLSSQLDNFSKQGYNKGIDAKNWVTDNFNKSRIKTGGQKIHKYLSDWYGAAKGFSESAHTTIANFFKDWEKNRETMHVVFKALGNSFSIIGSLMGSFETDGESKMKILFEVIGKPEFKSFMNEVSTMMSKNPDLMSSLQGNDVTDVLSAFRQDSTTVISTLKELNEKGDGKVDRDKLMNALKLYSLMDKATNLVGKARKILQSRDKQQAQALIKEIEAVYKQIDDMIKANEAEAKAAE